MAKHVCVDELHNGYVVTVTEEEDNKPPKATSFVATNLSDVERYMERAFLGTEGID
jgi:hypothetical protein